MSKSIEELFAHQKKWSAKTFGDHLDTTGVVDHIKKEIEEIKAAPDDVEEWADLFILAMDGLWRSGYEFDRVSFEISYQSAVSNSGRLIESCEEAVEHGGMFHFLMAAAAYRIKLLRGNLEQVVHAKQQKNAARQWPNKADMDPTKAIEHVKPRKRTITLQFTYDDSNVPVTCLHVDTYDGALDSNHPLGYGIDEFDALDDWLKDAGHISDDDLSEYLAEPTDNSELPSNDDSDKITAIERVIASARRTDQEVTNSIDARSVLAAAFNDIADIVGGDS